MSLCSSQEAQNMVNSTPEVAHPAVTSMLVLMRINTMANRCGYFYNAYLAHDAKLSPNNGYNCRHPDCEDVEEGAGCCHAWSCPLCYEADEIDCARYGAEYESHEFVICEIPASEFDENRMWELCGEEASQ